MALPLGDRLSIIDYRISKKVRSSALFFTFICRSQKKAVPLQRVDGLDADTQLCAILNSTPKTSYITDI